MRRVSNSALARSTLSSDDPTRQFVIVPIHGAPKPRSEKPRHVFSSPSTFMGTPRLSGLARQALSLHRALLRAARRKSPEARAGIEAAIRAEFERHRHLDPRDLQAVEHRIRAGRKKLALIDDPNVVAASGMSR